MKDDKNILDFSNLKIDFNKLEPLDLVAFTAKEYSEALFGDAYEENRPEIVAHLRKKYLNNNFIHTDVKEMIKRWENEK